MYHTTGFTKAEITELCATIEARELSPRMRRWPRVLGLRNALTVTLTYLRRNQVQAEIAENYGVSQPTISRAISAITPLLVQALLGYVPTAGELDVGTCYIVDGTLLPCWSWRAHPELYSGKRKTTGMNVQVCARNPQAMPRKVRNDGAVNDGAVNSGPKTASRPASEAGSGGVMPGIGGNPRSAAFQAAPL